MSYKQMPKVLLEIEKLNDDAKRNNHVFYSFYLSSEDFDCVVNWMLSLNILKNDFMWDGVFLKRAV